MVFANYDGWIKVEEQITGTKAVILNMDMQIQEWANQNEGPHKILLMGESGQIDKIEPVLKKITFNRPNIYKSKPTYLEIMSDPASKTSAIIFLITKYGLTNKDVLAIGDNYNDIEMLRFAGMGIAMGNAPDQVKAHAKYITLDNDSDGVKFALDAFIKLSNRHFGSTNKRCFTYFAVAFIYFETAGKACSLSSYSINFLLAEYRKRDGYFRGPNFLMNSSRVSCNIVTLFLFFKLFAYLFINPSIFTKLSRVIK